MPATSLAEQVPTRDRIAFASAELFRRRGYTGTGLKQIAAESQAPFGSIYHHFPGGKEEIGEDVIRRGGEFFRVLVMATLAEGADATDAVRQAFASAAETLLATDYEDACPIAVIALEVASTNERLRAATSDVFESWLASGADYFAAAGIAPAPARDLAVAMVCALEGAFLLCRVSRTTTALTIAGEMAARMVADELDSATPRAAARRRR